MKLRNLTFQILEEFFVSPSIIYLVKKFMLSKHVHAFSHPEFQVTHNSTHDPGQRFDLNGYSYS